jgi:hypothetical protein
MFDTQRPGVVSIATLVAIRLGGFMTDQQRQQPLTQSSPSGIEPVQDLASASATGWRQEKCDQGQENEWEARLENLQQLICDLLIKNQQLRWLLEAATNHQCQEFANEYDQNVARG